MLVSIILIVVSYHVLLTVPLFLALVFFAVSPGGGEHLHAQEACRGGLNPPLPTKTRANVARIAEGVGSAAMVIDCRVFVRRCCWLWLYAVARTIVPRGRGAIVLTGRFYAGCMGGGKGGGVIAAIYRRYTG